MPDFLKLVRPTSLAALLLAAPAVLPAADSQQPERISAASILALGRLPDAREIAATRDEGARSISELVDRLITDDPAQRRGVARQAYRDAFGAEPPAEVVTSGQGGYAAQVAEHLRELRAQPAEYRAVVQRAYQRVIRRDPYPEEIAYWNRYDVVPFSLLTASLQNWARRNQPGLMVTSGAATVSVNSDYLATVRLTGPLIAEAAAALGTPRTQDDADRAQATARNVLSPGGAQLISNGGIAFVAAGKPNR